MKVNAHLIWCNFHQELKGYVFFSKSTLDSSNHLSVAKITCNDISFYAKLYCVGYEPVCIENCYQKKREINRDYMSILNRENKILAIDNYLAKRFKINDCIRFFDYENFDDILKQEVEILVPTFFIKKWFYLFMRLWQHPDDSISNPVILSVILFLLGIVISIGLGYENLLKIFKIMTCN